MFGTKIELLNFKLSRSFTNSVMVRARLYPADIQ